MLALLLLAWAVTAHAESKPEQTFSDEFVRLLKQGAAPPLLELVQRSDVVVHPVIAQWSRAGLQLKAGGTGDGGAAYLGIAHLMAHTYGAQTGRRALADTVARYVGWDRATAQQWQRAETLVAEGLAHGDARAEAALQRFLAAEAIYARLDDELGLVVARTAIAKLHYALGDMVTSGRVGSDALTMARAQGSWGLVADNLTNLGLVQVRRGQYGMALLLLEGALQAEQHRGNGREEGNARLNLGHIYLYLGRNAEAAAELRAARDTLAAHNAEEGAAKASMNLGLAEFRLGRNPEALQAYHAALTAFTRLGLAGQQAAVLLNLGAVYDTLDSPARAYDNYARARDMYKQAGDHEGETSALVNLGRAALRLGRRSEAIVLLEDVGRRAETSGNTEAVVRAQWGLGAALRQAGRLEEAAAAFARAIDAVERLHGGSRGLDDDTRASLAAEKRFVYQEYLDVLVALHARAPGARWDRVAFAVSERAKSRVFQELIGKAAATTALHGDPAFQQAAARERSLSARVTAERQRLAASSRGAGADATSLRGDVTAAEQALRAHQLDMDARYPRYAEIRRPRPVAVQDLQAALRPDQAAVSYALGNTSVVAFVVRKSSFRLVPLDTTRVEVERRVDQMRQALDVADVASLDAFDPALAHALYRTLFAPVLPHLGDAARLYLSADGVLYTLPFEALVDRPVDPAVFAEARRRGREQGVAGSEFGALHYLVDTYTITYVPTVSLLSTMTTLVKPGRDRWRTPLVAFADPIFEPGDTQSSGERRGISQRTARAAAILARSTGRGQLARLKESGDEALALARELNAPPDSVHLRDRATEANVYRADLAGARYVLFATHGLLSGDVDDVAEPALALTLVGNPEDHDGFLTASEVLGLDLNADMVVLSACNTAGPSDRAGRGEGFAGLTRSFMYAGARSVLVTHWSVESLAARDLMIEAFRRLPGSGRAAALREAKLALKRSTRSERGRAFALAHPYFWSAFVLVGED